MYIKGIGIGAAATATAIGLGVALNSKDGVGKEPAYSLFSSMKHYTAAKFGTSGIIFKDTLEVEALEDPKVEGITIYVSRVKRPMVDKMRHGFFQVHECMNMNKRHDFHKYNRSKL